MTTAATPDEPEVWMDAPDDAPSYQDTYEWEDWPPACGVCGGACQ